jgi:membrane protein DedA with SNARE-associated domain
MTAAVALGLALGTFVSEDLACVSAALLIRQGGIDPVVAIAACTAGIFTGDCGLWAAGRLARHRVQRHAWLAQRFPLERAEALRSWLERDGVQALVASRFFPGTRLPLYVAAGLAGMSGKRFAAATLAAAAIWTPIVVLAASSTATTLAPVLILLALVVARRLTSVPRMLRISARVARWRSWEFWPMWLFYSPVAIWVALLAVRHRGFSTITAANPGMTDGGVVGESKSEILRKLPDTWTIPSVLISPASAASVRGRTAADRVRQLADHLTQADWTFPLVLKPDVGQRGLGVRLVRDIRAVREYLEREPGAVLAQPYHEGPFEAGVFYYRMPWWTRGRVFSITDKQFPWLVGDGRSTLEELIWQHPRYRLQAHLFLERHAAAGRRVLAEGERFQLAIAGNHAQGTLFRSGARLLTLELEERIDEIAQAFPGFFVGRFDIRYRDEDEFRAGRGLAIVELNGATAESTDIYDPDNSLLAAYGRLFRQWSIVFAIGAANRAAGAPVTPAARLCALVRAHLTTRATSDH